MTKLSSRYFIDLTQPEIAAQLQDNPLVILPAGSVEQHGPHLPTGTDIYAANVISHAVAERMNGLVLPGGPLGVTPMHMPFEGTITLTHDTYIRVVTETCVSTARHGAKYLLILNWHEGNCAQRIGDGGGSQPSRIASVRSCGPAVALQSRSTSRCRSMTAPMQTRFAAALASLLTSCRRRCSICSRSPMCARGAGESPPTG